MKPPILLKIKRLAFRHIYPAIAKHPLAFWLFSIGVRVVNFVLGVILAVVEMWSGRKTKFYFHPGAPKTGTTTLQQNIFPHHSQLILRKQYKTPRKYSIRHFLEYLVIVFTFAIVDLFRPKKQINNQTNPPHKIIPVSYPPKRKSASFIYSNEVLLSTKPISYLENKLPRLTKQIRSRTKVFYVTRAEETHLASLYLHALAWHMRHGWFGEMPTFNEFVKLVFTEKSSISNQSRLGAATIGAFNHVYNPQPLIQKILSRFSDEIAVLPYELLAEDPNKFLEKMSDILEIDAKETKRLYKDALKGKNQRFFTNMKLMKDSKGHLYKSMRQRGLDFCNGLVMEFGKYKNNINRFHNNAESYAATLPAPMRKIVLSQTRKVQTFAELPNAITNIYSTEPFGSWLTEGKKAEVKFPPKELAKLRKIRAPQNRWIAKEFNLDLAGYGYSM